MICLKGEKVFLSVIEALHCSGCLQLAEVRISPQLRRITGLVQHCAWPFKGVRVPVAQLRMGPPVRIRYSSTYARALKCQHVASIPTIIITKYIYSNQFRYHKIYILKLNQFKYILRILDAGSCPGSYEMKEYGEW